MGLTWPYWALHGLTGSYWAILGLTGPYWALLGLTSPNLAYWLIGLLSQPKIIAALCNCYKRIKYPEPGGESTHLNLLSSQLAGPGVRWGWQDDRVLVTSEAEKWWAAQLAAESRGQSWGGAGLWWGSGVMGKLWKYGPWSSLTSHISVLSNSDINIRFQKL